MRPGKIRLEDPDTWPVTAREYFLRWQRDRVGQPELEAIVRARIHDRGRITFAEFMALALYHPLYGYYRSDPTRMTAAGDYLTSPETDSAFGFLIARWLWGGHRASRSVFPSLLLGVVVKERVGGRLLRRIGDMRLPKTRPPTVPGLHTYNL